MFKILVWLSAIISFLVVSKGVDARYDPVAVENNRFGIHVLDPGEIDKAAKLVNSSGGEWGYVTVPIRADDRDRRKWQEFFEKARELKVVPILRIATYGRGETWIIPTEAEMLDFANFLNEMPWPTGNRYIAVFNEVNHSREWGGFIEPEKYAEVLADTIEVFKGRGEEFFLMPAAMDQAAPNNHTSLSGMDYIKRMFAAQPELVNKIDGWNSHAYPNPGFVGKPTDTKINSIVSYRHELEFLKSLGRQNIPVFITETGWSQGQIPNATLESYWKQAFETIWHEKEIVAITPFLLQATEGPFRDFSFLNSDGSVTLTYATIERMPKKAGKPELVPYPEPRAVLGDGMRVMNDLAKGFELPIIDIESLIRSVQDFFQNLIADHKSYMTIGESRVEIEIVDTADKISLGLGHRPSMPEDQGMLFVFDQKHVPSFWMKNTLFPLDIVWMRDGKVVDLTTNIPVESDPDNPKNFYSPKMEVDQVLEVNGGWVERNGIKIGDEVRIYE